VHYGLATTTNDRRVQTLAAAGSDTAAVQQPRRPEDPRPPDAAWINPPIIQTEDQEKEPVTEAA